MTGELFAAIEKTAAACGLKVKDPATLEAGLKAMGIVLTVAGGLLEVRQGDQLMSTGTVLASYAAKFPRQFYGAAGDISYKSDLVGDDAAKRKFISERGLKAWSDLPLNKDSPTAKNVITSQIAHAGMKRSEYENLSTGERVRLISEVGAAGISRILSRK
jgi:hypothetical protein